MRREDVRRMEAVARELDDRPGDPPEPLGKLSAAEMALAPITREWIEREEAWAYFGLQMARGIRLRLARMGERVERSPELHRLATAREIAARHLDALREAGALADPILIEMARAEDLQP